MSYRIGSYKLTLPWQVTGERLVPQLDRQIATGFYERTARSRKPSTGLPS
jgi:hypothetical protein